MQRCESDVAERVWVSACLQKLCRVLL
eukprot:COSAG01_NODE_74322_length_218_cov_1.983193_1_plen_26_part_01